MARGLKGDTPGAMANRFSFPRIPLVHYWSSQRGLAALLVSLGLLIFVFLPLEMSGLIGPLWMFAMDVWMAGVILAGASALGWQRVQRGILVLALVLLVAMLALRFLARGFPVRWTETVASAVSVVVLSVLVALIVAQVFRNGPTARDRIFGAVAAYLLLGLNWAEAYRLVDVLVPGSFHGLVWAPGGHNLSSFVYFSLSTLTTAGYGDIVPLTLPARSLANMESLAGQLFPAILIARLVSMSLASQRPPP
jgi:Ion channel